MPSIRLDIVTAEGAVYSDDVDVLVAPGVEGQLGILPHHTPLMTMLQPGELRVRKGGEEVSLAITGGFLEVRPDRVIVLADAAERVRKLISPGQKRQSIVLRNGSDNIPLIWM